MNWNEIEKGEFYTYKDERGKEKRVKALTGNRTVKIDLRRNKIERHSLVIEDDSGMKTMIFSDSKNFFEIQPFKSELPDTGLLVSVRGEIAFRTSHNHGYGFTVEGNYVEDKTQTWGFEKPYLGWRPATKEDEKRWKGLLADEAKRRGYVKGVKAKCLIDGKLYTLDGGIGSNVYSLSAFWLSTTELRNAKVMKNGKWARIIEEPKECETKNHFIDPLIYTTANI